MLKNREELDKARSSLKRVSKTIGDKVTEQRKLQTEIAEFENSCRHQWDKRVYNDKTDRFRRECQLCGKERIDKE
jgi:mRNA-degrading endonuclease RelE of RelBE toxin-antitoxin system